MTIHWKDFEQYFTVVLFVFQFYPVCSVPKFISFGVGTVRSKRVSSDNHSLVALTNKFVAAGLSLALKLQQGKCGI